MKGNNSLRFSSRWLRGCLTIAAIFLVLAGLPVYVGISLWYSETKGPFKNATQVVDLEGDGDLDVLVSHTRWEDEDLSWAGIGRWINQRDGRFERLREQGTEYFAGFAGGAADFDRDGDTDVFVANSGIRLLQNQGGVQGGTPGEFRSSGGINPPAASNQGYRDMGGTILTGDLNGDGWTDALIAGCCYGLNPTEPGYETPNLPSVSWVWINDGAEDRIQRGHNIELEFLDGLPIREAAIGDIDGDGDLDAILAVDRPTMGSTPSLDDLILLNDGLGNLEICEQKLVNQDSTSVALGDVNGDSRLDILVGTNDGAQLWLNQGTPEDGVPLFIQVDQTFQATRSIKDRLLNGLSATASGLFRLYLPYGSTRTRAVFLRDLDGDADLDVLIARLWGAEIWWNLGQANFQPSGVHFAYREDTGVAVSDFDRDGDEDIFAASGGDAYQVWLNTGSGNFVSNNSDR